jgi:outer membrane protein assembly factor BamB
MMTLRILLIALLGCLLYPGLTPAADWPWFGGPDQTGVSPETGLARQWPPDGPRVLWTLDVGEGFAGVAIRDGQVFLLDRAGEQQDVLRCLDLSSGKELWSVAYDAPGELQYPGSRNVPTVQEKFIYTVGPFGHVKCIDRATHAVVWSHHLVEDFKDPQIDQPGPPKNKADSLARSQIPRWGVTQIPTFYKDLIILSPQTQKVGAVAYDKTTGQLRWTSPYIGRNWFNHSSPFLLKLCGVDQVIVLAQPSDPDKAPAQAPPANICSIDPQNGQILWKTQTPRPYKIPVTHPVPIGGDRLVMTGCFGVGCLVLKVSRDGDQWSSQWVVQNRTFSGNLHGPILYKGLLYVHSFKEHGAQATGLVCTDLEGQLKWQTGPSLTFDSGGMIVADGLAFCMHGKTGELHLLEIGPEGYKVLAKAKVLEAEGGTAWAPLALSQGKLIVRDQRQMKCLDVK